ncbi:hypothetical protein ACLOAV_009286 [Pseudogymnoascus australis]
MATSSSGGNYLHNTYADYVASTYGDNYNEQGWLVRFLRQSYNIRYGERRQPNIEIHVLDSFDDNLQSQSFIALRRGPVDQRFLDILRRPLGSSDSSQRRTRLLLLQCGQLGDTNGSYIDAIGLHYMLNPYFFSAHFELCRDLPESGSFVRTFAPALLPSERPFLQIVTDNNSHMTMSWEISDTECTFIILGLDHYGPGRLTKLRDELQRKSPSELRMLNESPADFIFPYIRDSARAAASLCARHAHIRSRATSVIPSDWEWNQSNRRALITSKTNLTRVLENPKIDPILKSVNLRTLLLDYAALIDETEVISSDIQGLLQQKANEASIEEMKRGLAQTDSVRRLTLVAFVFIPLSFATSFFGMNIEQLGSSGVHIGYFLLLAALAGGLSLALSTSLKPLEAAWNRARRRHALEEYQDDDKDLISSITKRNILWAFVRRHFPPAKRFYAAWGEFKYSLPDDPDQLSSFTILYYMVKKTAKDIPSKIRNLRLSASKTPDNTTQAAVTT